MISENQKILREKLNRYLDVNGIKAKKIANDIKLDAGCLSRFRKGKILLWPETYELLRSYLDDKF